MALQVVKVNKVQLEPKAIPVILVLRAQPVARVNRDLLALLVKVSLFIKLILALML